MNSITSILRKSLFFRALTLGFLLPGVSIFPSFTYANPSGGVVVNGNVNFVGMGTANLNINQGSHMAIINWNDFSIANGEVTTFNQPTASSMTLNRVVTGNPSAIYGQLNANGGVLVINPNGILVGPSGVIDTGGLLALSTLDITNEDFLNGGAMRFQGNTSAGIVNYGALSSANGDVVLLGNFLQNMGSVHAPDGTVAFGAGGDIVVDQAGGAKISVLAGGAGGGTGIENSGEISGAAAELKAHGNVYALAIKNDGIVRASGYNYSGGRLTLSAGTGGRLVNTGDLYAQNSDGSGGRINVSGHQVEMVSGRVDASGLGNTAGGQVTIAADQLDVDAGVTIAANGSSGGSINLTGVTSVDFDGIAEAKGSTTVGGTVDIQGSDVNVGSNASVDVTGVTGGGRIRVGGGFQGNEGDIMNAAYTDVDAGAKFLADATAGDAGDVIIWSDENTTFKGQISARALGAIGNGGFVEISGKQNLHYSGAVTTMAMGAGENGTLLFDPTDVFIGPGALGITMTDDALVAAVLQNNVVIHTSSAGSQAGNIWIRSGSDIQYDSPNSLSFFAHGSIFVDGDVKNHGSTDTAYAGTGHINLVAGWDGTGAGAFAFDPITGAGAGGSNLAISFADINAGTYGTWGNNAGNVIINLSGDEPVEVGSARGETNVFGNIVLLQGGNTNGEFSQIGYRRENDLRGRAISGLGADGLIGTGDDVLISTFSVDADTGIAGDIDFETGVTGDINVIAVGDVLLQPQGSGANTGDRRYTMIGHGGRREQDNDMDSRANVTNDSLGATDFGSDSGNTTVGNGNNHGNITVIAGGKIELSANRAESHAQIGHGGGGHDDPDADRGNTASDTGLGDNNDGNVSIVGDMSGDITVQAASIEMTGGQYNDAYTMIGHGGERVRGEHSGNISVTSDGRIRATASPDDNSVGWNSNRDRSWTQIGHGGYRSYHYDTLRLAPGGATDVATRQLGVNINPNTGRAFGHSGTIDVNAGGDIHFTASGNQAYAMIGHGGVEMYGDHSGDITVDGGNIIFDRITNQVDGNGTDNLFERGAAAHVQIGHGGGARSGGGADGDINVTASGNFEMYAGRSEAYAQLGHGGFSQDWGGVEDQNRAGERSSRIDDNGVLVIGAANQFTKQRTSHGTKTGDINLTASGNVKFRGGFGGTWGVAYAQLGHGGRNAYADQVGNSTGGGALGAGGVTTSLDTGHHGDIMVDAGGDISFKAGADSLQQGQVAFEENMNDNFAMLGHGGLRSYGNHWGEVDVSAGGDLEFEARGGYNAVGINGAAATSTDVRLNVQTVNNGGQWNVQTGKRNFAQLGHGGFDSDPSTGRIGTGGDSVGLGVLGNSDISIDVGGDIEVLGAMKATAGPLMRKRHITVTRSNGDVWTMPAPVHYAEDSFAMIGHGGRAHNINGAGNVDGNGFRGDITINSGGGIRVEAGDIKSGVVNQQSLVVQSTGGDFNIGPGSTNAPGPNGTAESISQRNFAMIGLGGRDSRGDHVSDITITGNGDLQVLGGMGQEDFAQIGNGGMDSDQNNNNGTGRNGDTGNSGSIIIDMGSGGVAVHGGGRESDVTGDYGTTAAAGRNDRTRSRYAMIGHGGAYNGGSHSAQLIQVHADGDISVVGGTGSHTSQAQIGNGGGSEGTGRVQELTGDISVVSRLGNIEVRGGAPIVDTGGATVNAFGETISNIDNTGHVSLARSSFGQIGHGGHDIDVQVGGAALSNVNNNGIGNGGFTGNIEVVAVQGDITLQGGGSTVINADNDNFRSNYAQIGNGGNFSDGDHGGDILVSAGGTLNVTGGVASRESHAQIGHGGYDVDGDLSGTIDINVNNLVMTRGEDNTAGALVRNNWSKIGHGAQAFGGRNNNGSGDRSGDITVSVGNNLTAIDNSSGFGPLIGHFDPQNGGYTQVGVSTGNTYIAVGRNDPSPTGTGTLTTGSGAVFASADGGFLTELRLYMPTANQDQIAQGTRLNNANYTRTPAPGTRLGQDEHLATEHTMGTGAFGEPAGTFTPEGPYPSNSFGLYNIYFSTEVIPPPPPVPPAAPPAPLPPAPTPPPVFSYLPFIFQDQYDNFIRDDFHFAYDGYEGQMYGIGLDDGVIGAGAGLGPWGEPFFSVRYEAGRRDTAYSGPWIVEMILDDVMGSRQAPYLEGEGDEELRRIQDRYRRKVGMGNISFYVFDPGTNRYSSYRVFGSPRTATPAAE